MNKYIKIFSLVFLVCITGNSVFAWNYGNQEKIDSLLGKAYTKIDTLYQKDPQIIGKLLWKIETLSEQKLNKADAWILESITTYITQHFPFLTQKELQELKKEKFTLWESNTHISIVEFTDLQCPFCKKLSDTKILENILSKNPKDVNYTLTHFPFYFHQSAFSWALATECAWEIWGTGKFYEMSEKVISFLSTGALLNDAAVWNLWIDIGIQENTLKECMYNVKTSEVINNSIQQWDSIFGINGTPTTLFINNSSGRYIKVEGAQPTEVFNQAYSDITK